MTKPVLVVIDDDPIIGEIISYAGTSVGFDVHFTEHEQVFEDNYLRLNPAIIMMDLVMPECDVNALLQWLAEHKCNSPIILMSGYHGKYLKCAQILGNSLGLSVVETMEKPISVQEIEAILVKNLREGAWR